MNQTDKIPDLVELEVGPSEYCWSQTGPEFTLDLTLWSLCQKSWRKEIISVREEINEFIHK